MADTTNASLTPQAIRIECLRMAQRPDKDTDWIVKRAEEFERFVAGPQPPTEPSEEVPATTDKATAKPRSKSS